MADHEFDVIDAETPSAVAIRAEQRASLEARPPADWLTIEARVRDLYAPKCDDAEWEIYKAEAKELDLSPVRKEFIPLMIGSEEIKQPNGYSFNPKRWRKKYSGYVTQAGMLALAERSGKLDAIEGPYWIGEKSSHQWVEYWLKEWGAPDAARVTVYRTDKTRPTTAVVTMSRARTSWVYDDNNRKTGERKIVDGLWTDDPAMMLGVRATTDALKKSGLLTALPDDSPLSIAAGRILAIEAGDADDNTAGRRLHAIANSRGLDHDDVRAVAQELNPGLESVAELDPHGQHAVADYIDMQPAERLADATDREETEITGEPRDIAPEPSTRPANGEQSAEQAAWFTEHARRIDWKRLSDETAGDFANREMLSYEEADRLIMELAKAVIDDSEAWSTFWRKARAAGFKSSREITAQTGEIAPDTLEESETWLAAAIQARAAQPVE